MAILVKYAAESLKDGGDTAIYLDHEFYTLIFEETVERNSHLPYIEFIARLKYKNPTSVWDTDELKYLEAELYQLASKHQHPQIKQMASICNECQKDQRYLLISSDMHTELK